MWILSVLLHMFLIEDREDITQTLPVTLITGTEAPDYSTVHIGKFKAFGKYCDKMSHPQHMLVHCRLNSWWKHWESIFLTFQESLVSCEERRNIDSISGRRSHSTDLLIFCIIWPGYSENSFQNPRCCIRIKF